MISVPKLHLYLQPSKFFLPSVIKTTDINKTDPLNPAGPGIIIFMAWGGMIANPCKACLAAPGWSSFSDSSNAMSFFLFSWWGPQIMTSILSWWIAKFTMRANRTGVSYWFCMGNLLAGHFRVHHGSRFLTALACDVASPEPKGTVPTVSSIKILPSLDKSSSVPITGTEWWL